MNNTNLMTIAEYLKREGRTLMEIAHAVLSGDENAPALCEDYCEVEPDRSAATDAHRFCGPLA